MTSVFEQIGGKDAINAAVDIFYTKVLADDSIKQFFDGVDMTRQINKQKAFLTMVTGGPNLYTGQKMREAHKHLDLNEDHFNAVAGHLQATLEELSVPEELIGQVMAVAASTKADVLNQ